MYTLLLRLAAPWQSWGNDSLYEKRRTETAPTKSGLIGLIASALGKSREDDLSDLRKLKFGVRVDQPGIVQQDYHTAYNPKTDKSYISKRDYLADAVFIAGISSDSKEQLEEISYALQHPVYPLFLGRRSCPPTLPLVLGKVKELPLEQALENEPFYGNNMSRPDNLKVIFEGDRSSGTRIMMDEPVTFSGQGRSYLPRVIMERYISIPGDLEHDPMEELL